MAARLTGWKIEVKPQSSLNNNVVKEPEYELTELNDDEAFEALNGFEEIDDLPSFEESKPSDGNEEK